MPRVRMLKWMVALVGALTMLAVAPAAYAATFTVASTADVDAAAPGDGCATAGDTPAAGACTLRSAVDAADAAGGANTIILPAGTYTLTNGELDFSSGTTTITGDGSATTTVTADGSSRDVTVEADATLTVSGVTFTGGDTFGGAYSTSCETDQEAAGPGGAIQDDGALTLTDDAVTDSKAGGNGGGIEDDSSDPLIIGGTTISGNVACPANGPDETSYGNGGGISEDGGADVMITDSTISGNFAPGYYGDEDSVPADGGGIGEFGGSATITVTSSTVSDNTASDDGGGIAAEGSFFVPGELALDGDTLSGNTAEGDSFDDGIDGGGAMYAALDATSVENTTITGNSAPSGLGGGIELNDSAFESQLASAQIAFSTITDNTSGDGGGNLADFAFEAEIQRPESTHAAVERANGDIAPDPSAAGFIFDDSIITGGTSGDGPSNCAQDGEVNDSRFASGGANIFDDDTCAPAATPAPADRAAITPNVTPADTIVPAGTQVVQPLANNGGPTQTQALLASSPAVDAANTAACAAETGTPPVDQRGTARPQGSGCDIGAFELVRVAASPDLTLTAAAAQPSVTVGSSDTITDTITNVGLGGATGVTFTDPGTGGYTITGATSGQGSCTTTASTVRCALGSLAAGASTTVSITVTGTAAGSVVLDSGVTEDQTDPTPANNLASVSITVTAPGTTPAPPTSTTATTTTTTTTQATPKPAVADLALTKTASVRRATLGARIAYRLSVTNHGPDTSVRVVLTDHLPIGLTLLRGSLKGAHCTGTQVLRCALGTLRKGARLTVTYTVTATRTGTLVNSAKVQAGTHDPHHANNDARASVTVVAPAPTSCIADAVITDGYDPSGHVNLAQVYVNGRLLKTVTSGNLRRISVKPPVGKLSFTVKVVFYATDESTDTVVRDYRDCRSGSTRVTHTAPVPPALQS